MSWPRRSFLALLSAPRLLPAGACRHMPAVFAGASGPGLPAGKRVPFGWQAIGAGEGVALRFRAPGDRLRLCMAVDSRERKKLEARSAASGKTVAEFDLRFAYALQIFEAALERDAARTATREGLTLHQTGGAEPAWILSGGAPAALLPHLMQPGTAKPLDEFYRRLQGLESLQPFGWMEGCVLDGLAALGYETALERHLAHFVPDSRRLIYENPRSEPADDRVASIEDTLPFAHLVLRRPDHPAIDAAIAYWKSHQDGDGCIVNGGMTSAEGSYTVAYPLARVARARRSRELEELAVRQLRLRMSRLTAADGLFLRNTAGKSRSYRNWSRGVAWYMLGLVRTLDVLKDRTDLADLRAEMRRAADWALKHQLPDGLWSCYLDDPATRPETSGSAGIAAAIALAARAGMVEGRAADAAERTWRGLERHLTPDGFLSGVAQSNRGGEELQRSGYRVISQMGMGLMGQLAGALRRR